MSPPCVRLNGSHSSACTLTQPVRVDRSTPFAGGQQNNRRHHAPGGTGAGPPFGRDRGFFERVAYRVVTRDGAGVYEASVRRSAVGRDDGIGMRLRRSTATLGRSVQLDSNVGHVAFNGERTGIEPRRYAHTFGSTMHTDRLARSEGSHIEFSVSIFVLKGA